jgi:short-subunit dehydrogenase
MKSDNFTTSELGALNVVITGAGKGIGKATAEKFAAEGNELFICARNEKELSETAKELETKYNCNVFYFPADLSEKKAAQEFGNWLLQKTSGVDVLINNAGQFIPGNIYNEEDGLLEKMININLYAAYHLTRTLLPNMMGKKQGHIFNVCSIAALQAYANGGSYSISKFALMGLSKNLREELKPYNIKVTAVYPGAVYTSSWFESGVAASRIMEASDIADIIYCSSKLSPQACVEDIIIRPQLGDL